MSNLTYATNALIVCLVVAGNALGAQQKAAHLGAATPELLSFTAFSFTAEGGKSTTADSTTLVAPMNRSRSGKATVNIPLVRFRSTSRSPGAPIIYLSGGSGSGISAAAGPRFAFFQELRQAGDVVVFDLRGAGRSRPRLGCSSDRPIPVGEALSYEALVSLLRRNARECSDSLRRAGVDLTGFNVRETVEDIDAIRRGLGATQVRLVGISTGSQIGLEYVRRYGRHLSHAVLAGIQGPDQLIDLPSAQERVLRELSEQLGKTADSSAQSAVPDLFGVAQSVIKALGSNPATVRIQDRRSGDSVTVHLGALDAQVLISATLGNRKQMQILPAVFGAAARGDYAPLAAFKSEASRSGINSAFEALQDCQTGVSAARLAGRASEARTSLLGWGTLDFPEHCDGWGVPKLDGSWRKPVQSAASVLLISGTLDGRTSVRNAEAVLLGLRNGMHLVVEGASHGDDLFLSTTDISRVILSFLRGRTARELRAEVQ
ncbi:MAG: alpha/beta fold hydrolase [Anaerolineae bacterium]|nr:alpha/beta fold hydrolase [Gemmatimonadaceae bacterium]